METKNDIEAKKEDYASAPAAGAPPASDTDRIAALESKVDQILSLLQSLTQEESAEPASQDMAMAAKAGSGEKEVLPKAPAGETDEKSPKVDDKIRVTEKMVEKKVEDVLKSMGLVKKATTPRVEQEEKDITKSKATDPMWALIKKAEKGEISRGDFNKSIKKMEKERRAEGIKEVLAEVA